MTKYLLGWDLINFPKPNKAGIFIKHIQVTHRSFGHRDYRKFARLIPSNETLKINKEKMP
jgi:hypothetical protein